MRVLPGVPTADAGMGKSIGSLNSSTSVYYRSYLYRDWMMRRAIISAVIGFIMLAIGIGVTVSLTSCIMYISMPRRQQNVKFQTDV